MVLYTISYFFIRRHVIERLQSDSGIKAFSDSQKVQKYIVIGRLMKDGTIPWSAKNRLKYNWA